MTAISLAPAGLVGRRAELDVLFDLVDRVRERDQTRALVMRGEPGIGKTSLLTAAEHRASDGGVQVLSTAIHLQSCPGCQADHAGLLEAARRFADVKPE